MWQEFTEILQKNTGRILDLFQRRYAHTLIVIKLSQRKQNLETNINSCTVLPSLPMISLTFLHIFELVQVGVGLMLLQQFAGTNAVAYFASTIFIDAGNQKPSTCNFFLYLNTISLKA